MKHDRIRGGRLAAALWLSLAGPLCTVHAQQPEPSRELAAQSPAPSALAASVEESLGTVERRYLTAGVHTPWQIMHGVLALGDRMYLREGADGELVRAIDFICLRATPGGRRIVETTPHGLRFIDSYQTQGHPDQFLAMFAQVGVPETTPIEVGADRFTVADLVKNAQAETGRHGETSWTIVALSHYLGPDAEWRNQYDQRYTLEGLVRWELDQSVESGACGGTHRLTALSRALADFRRSGRPLHGTWQQAHERVRRYLAKAESYQSSDGGFSSDFFLGSSRTSNLEDHLHSHGHTLEWVVNAVEPEELDEPWVRRAVEHLCQTLIANRSRPIDCGSLYHAGSALRIYRERCWGNPAPAPELAETTFTPTAERPAPSGPAAQR